MTLQITIPKSDMAKGIPIPEGWKKFALTEVFAKASKNGDSTNYIVVHKLVDDPNERTIEHNFNSKVIGLMAPFIAALQQTTVQQILESMDSGELTFDLEEVKGNTVLGKVYHDVYQGRVISKIEEWAHPDKVPF